MYSMLNIQIDNAIRFKRAELMDEDPQLFDRIKQDLEIANPDYWKAKAQEYSTYNIPRTIDCYEYDKDADELTLPRGYLTRFVDHVDVELNWNTVHLEGLRVPTDIINLRDYQEPAVEDCLRKDGVLVAPTGAGKTSMALELARRIGYMTLWITHKNDLAAQVIERAVEYLGIPASDIGMIGGGKECVGPWLTVGTVQTLARRDLTEYADVFGTVIMDECHHAPADTFKTILHAFRAAYRYGVTATPKRSDGLEKMMHLYIGPTLHTISEEIVAEAGGTVTPDLKVVGTGADSSTWAAFEEEERDYKKHLDEYKEYQKLGKWKRKPRKPRMPYSGIITELLESTSRNNLILNTIAQYGSGHSNLVLTARKEHAHLLAGELPKRSPELRPAVIDSDTKTKARVEMLQAMREGDLDILFAVDIPKEGLDVPILDRLYFVAGGKDPIMVQQASGRIRRPHPDKSGALIVDFVDWNVPIMKVHFFQRRRIYSKLGIVSVKAVTV